MTSVYHSRVYVNSVCQWTLRRNLFVAILTESDDNPNFSVMCLSSGIFKMVSVAVAYLQHQIIQHQLEWTNRYVNPELNLISLLAVVCAVCSTSNMARYKSNFM